MPSESRGRGETSRAIASAGILKFEFVCRVSEMKKNVVVFNHFAVTKGHAGGTRHVELFDLLADEWDYMLVAADRNLFSRESVHATSGAFRSVRTTPYRGNGPGRILNWVSYSVSAFVVGVRQPQLDVVYASSPHLLAGLAGFILARIRRAGFVLEIRDLWPQILVDMGRMRSTSISYRILRSLELFLYHRADEIVVLTEGSRDAIRADCPGASTITLVPNGSDPAMFAIDAERSMLRQRYGMDGLVLVYAGAHGPANGLELVLDAAERVRTDLPDVSFVLVGDGVEKPALVAEAKMRRLTNVQFHDPIPKSEVPSLLRAADVGLHVLADVPLFRYGVSPNKLFDYMAAGLPVVTNCPGEVERVVHRADAGVAVEPTKLEDAVRVVAAASDDQLEAWGQGGQDYVKRHLSREILAHRLAGVLDRVVKK